MNEWTKIKAYLNINQKYLLLRLSRSLPSTHRLDNQKRGNKTRFFFSYFNKTQTQTAKKRVSDCTRSHEQPRLQIEVFQFSAFLHSTLTKRLRFSSDGFHVIKLKNVDS